MTYENILVDVRGRVATITLNRPKALNALNDATMREIVAAGRELDADPDPITELTGPGITRSLEPDAVPD